MSWDVFIFAAPAGVASVDQIADDFVPAPLGSFAGTALRLREAVPTVDLTDPTWGMLDGPTWSIELNIGSPDPVQAIMLHVSGAGDDVLPVIARITAAVGGRALDVASGDFLTDNPAGWHAFQQYRDTVIDQP